jgi:hypothetical protein
MLASSRLEHSEFAADAVERASLFLHCFRHLSRRWGIGRSLRHISTEALGVHQIGHILFSDAAPADTSGNAALCLDM